MYIIAFLLYLALLVAFCEKIEVYNVYGPMELHSLAIEDYIKLKKEYPEDSMDYGGPFMTKGKNLAIKRMILRSDQDLQLRVSSDVVLNEPQSFVLQLPTPKSNHDHLSTAITSEHSSDYHLSAYRSIITGSKFHEDVRFGAISRAGALATDNNEDWLKLAEDKLKRENTLDYHSLLWEIGTDIFEKRLVEQGLNDTLEFTVVESLKIWFLSRGGKLSFVEPNPSKYGGFRLKSTELVDHNENVLSMPMQLIMCQQTARNVVIYKRGRYLGDELQKTFVKDEIWGLTIFLLHEYYKEVNGEGSKWGPFIRSLSMRTLTTENLLELKGTLVLELFKKWMKCADSLMWWSSGADGPCSPTTGICRTRPMEKTGDSRFNIHQIRWAYWIVKQNAVKVKHATTGYEFLALIPFMNMINRNPDSGGSITFDRNGLVSVRSSLHQEGSYISISPGYLSDSEYFVRYFDIPVELNDNNEMKLSLPGSVPKGSKFHFCVKGDDKQRNSDECKGSYRSEAMFWKSKVLTEWRNTMNLPPRLQELRMWATRLHLYGGQDEMKLLNTANQLIAGLPIPVDQMSAEEQLMMLGIVGSSEEAALVTRGPSSEHNIPQLYAAPDPEEDPEALRAMENLAYFAAQSEIVLSAGSDHLNATKIVLDHIHNFFVHGVLPMAGLDELDEFLLKKIGMMSHCGFENDMKLTYGNASEELLCAMRVHLMNETEMQIFCPSDVRVWEENCMNVEFLNFTAVNHRNEMAVIAALRQSIYAVLDGYSTTYSEDQCILNSINDAHSIYTMIVLLRLREKELLRSVLDYLETYEVRLNNGSIPYQLEIKAREREELNRQQAEFELFSNHVQHLAMQNISVSSIVVDTGDVNIPKLNISIAEGENMDEKVAAFCREHGFPNSNIKRISEALRRSVVNPPLLILHMGVIIPTGHRRIISISERSNVTLETAVFCAKYSISNRGFCSNLEFRVNQRINSSFDRRIIASISIDSIDGRRLKLIVREGEQHDLMQHVDDFFELYKLPKASVHEVALSLSKQLPNVALTIPVNMQSTRQIQCSFFLGDNITNTVEGFASFYEINDDAKLQILKRAIYGMSPGTYLM